MRPRKLVVGGVVIALLAGGAFFMWGRGEEPTGERYNPRVGFALWPEDNPSDAEAACESGDEWRRDPHEVALRFMREHSGDEDVNIFHGEPDDGSAVFGVDWPSPASESGSVVHLRQWKGCWYIHWVTHRSLGVGIEVGYRYRGERLEVIADVPSGIDSTLELAYGDMTPTVGRGENDELIFSFPRRPETAGHFILRLLDERGRVTEIGAERLPEPPAPATHPARLSPAGDRYTAWPEDTLTSAAEGCREKWQYGEGWRMKPRIVLRQWLSEVTPGKPRITTSALLRARKDGQRWRLRVDRATVEVDMALVGRNCWAIDRATTSNGADPRASLKLATNGITVDANTRRATEVSVTQRIGYGYRGWRFETAEMPLTFHASIEERRPGSFNVVLLRNGEIIGVQASGVVPAGD